jgi:hypothetical protein
MARAFTCPERLITPGDLFFFLGKPGRDTLSNEYFFPLSQYVKILCSYKLTIPIQYSTKQCNLYNLPTGMKLHPYTAESVVVSKPFTNVRPFVLKNNSPSE